MPRRSAEARAATFWQKSAGPPKAPRYLSPPARKLWKEIIAARPNDFFMPGSLQLLEQFCEVMIAARQAQIKLSETPLDAQSASLMRRLSVLSMQLASKLRLTLQASMRSDSGKAAEKITTARPWERAA